MTPIVETNINTGNRVPAKAFFEFLDTPLWDKAAQVPVVRVEEENLAQSGQRLSVTVHSDDRAALDNLPVAAILYDADGQAQAASVSVIPHIDREGQTQVVFTWPTAPQKPVIRAEVIALPAPR
jgi:hypothetical protein